MKYSMGDKVLFHDENQCEIRGVVQGINDYEHHTELLIELDSGKGCYTAKLMKRGNEMTKEERNFEGLLIGYGNSVSMLALHYGIEREGLESDNQLKERIRITIYGEMR